MSRHVMVQPNLRCANILQRHRSRAATRGMKGDEPEVDAARAPPQLTSLAHADQAASPYEARIMAGDDGSSSGEAASACTLFPGIYFLP